MPNFYNLLRARKFTTTADTAVEIAPSGSATPNFTIDAGGKLNWSSGSATADTNLYRSAANTLTTDDSLVVTGNLTVTGDVTVNGTTTTVNSTTLTIDDKNIELGSIASPSNTTADGGGITLKGATDKTINWINSTGAWTSSEDFNIVTGKVYRVNGVAVLSSTSVLNDATQTSITIGGSATTVSFGANSGTLTIGNPTVVGTQTTQNLYNSTATTLNFGGAATTIAIGASSGTMTIGNATITGTNATTLNLNGASPSIVTSSTGTASVFNTNALTGSIFGAASTINIGNTITAAQTVNLGTASTGASTYNFATGATASATTKTVNIGTGAAASSTTNINIGSSNGGTTTINSGTLVGAATTQNVFNTVATTVNAFGASTALSVGATTGTTTVNNGLVLKQVLETTTIDTTTNLTSGTATNIDVLTSSIYSFGTGAGTIGTNFTLNIRGNATVTDLNNLMANGQTLSVTVIIDKAGNTNRLNTIQINGVSQTINWFGGSAPTTGNALDIYTITILKTSASTYKVFASQAKFA